MTCLQNQWKIILNRLTIRHFIIIDPYKCTWFPKWLNIIHDSLIILHNKSGFAHLVILNKSKCSVFIMSVVSK